MPEGNAIDCPSSAEVQTDDWTKDDHGRKEAAERKTDQTVIDLRYGEASTVLTILTELAKHVETPVHVKGSNRRHRPTINVTLRQAGDRADLRQQYMKGRLLTIKRKSNHATEHFDFEWIAPRDEPSPDTDSWE